MKTWAWFSSSGEYVMDYSYIINQYGARPYFVTEIVHSDIQPTHTPQQIRNPIDPNLPDLGWIETRPDISIFWVSINGHIISYAAFENLMTGRSYGFDGSTAFETFDIYSVLHPNLAIHCQAKLDMNNYTIDEIAKLVLAYYKGSIDIGITSDAGDPTGTPRLFRAIDKIFYSNFTTSNHISKDLYSKTIQSFYMTNCLVAVTTDSPAIVHPSARIPAAKKFPLADDTKLLREYGMDPAYPIVLTWTLDPAPRWSFDWTDWGIETVFDLIAEVIG
ncbi:hypothetical protein [Pseudomonas paraglycinae]|jgi:hypothetical protein|uniref:hypothetical protein n=1 Tax=Pseudomonas paraglycinae TaxID=2892330 RepID=UPI001F275349|nr:hypothetical protein [Pseudomonas paraglycinae]